MTEPTPEMTEVTALRHGVLRIGFADGARGDICVLERIWGPVFESARTAEGFFAVYLDPESKTVTWPGGADLAPDTLYERVATGLWPHPAAA